MIQVTTRTTDTITRDLDRIKRELDRLPQQALEEFRDLTPIRSGNARRRTRLSGDVIQADYAYAERLDQGWSQQAPQGMTRPWETRVARRLQKIFGK
jgi:hypothetical protein